MGHAEIYGVEEATRKLNRLPPTIQDRLRVIVAQKTIDLREAIKEAIADIFKSTGPLYQSMQSSVSESIGSVTGSVFSQGVDYAAAQEYGGTWTIPEIFPVNAQALAFMSPGKLGFSSGEMTQDMVFTKHTKAHPVTLPSRSYARSTLFRMRDEIADDIAEATREAV